MRPAVGRSGHAAMLDLKTEEAAGLTAKRKEAAAAVLAITLLVLVLVLVLVLILVIVLVLVRDRRIWEPTRGVAQGNFRARNLIS